MARKESITKSMLLEAAFEMTREEGYENVTARRLATKTGCSTQPIFRVYTNMEELGEELFDKAMTFYSTYYQEYKKTSAIPFVNLGMAYIKFAQTEKNLFKLLFLSDNRHGKSMYEILNGSFQAVGHEINKAKAEGCKDPGGMFMKMWIFIHGAAAMSLTGDYDLDDMQTEKLLADSYQALGR